MNAKCLPIIILEVDGWVQSCCLLLRERVYAYVCLFVHVWVHRFELVVNSRMRWADWLGCLVTRTDGQSAGLQSVAVSFFFT